MSAPGLQERGHLRLRCCLRRGRLTRPDSHGTNTIWSTGGYNGTALAEHLSRTNAPAPCATTTPTATATNTAVAATPSPTCAVPQNYIVTNDAAPIAPGITDIGNHCDDCATSITLPFPFSLYGTTYTSAQAGSNGYLGFGTIDNFFYTGCLPDATATYNIFPYAVDQITGATGNYGIFTLTSGTAPNRTFYIEWRTCRYNGATTCLANSDANYEVVLQEGSSTFSIVYGIFGTANATVGAIGVQQMLS